MDLEIAKEKEIPLLNRKRVVLVYSSQEGKTPSRKNMLKEVAKKIGTKEDTVAIRHIYTQFGKTSAKIIAHVYKDRKEMEKYEDKNTLVKQGTMEKAGKNQAKEEKSE